MHRLVSIALGLFVAGCSGGTTMTMDSGRTGTDGGGTGTDGGGTGIDGGGTGTDAGGNNIDGGGLCTGSPECAGFQDVAPLRGCTLDATGGDTNCVARLHQVDCCGTMHAIGMNHGFTDMFCGDTADAEPACRASYMPAACDPGPITTDTGETTTDMNNVHVRCVGPDGARQCETYVDEATAGGVGNCGGTP